MGALVNCAAESALEEALVRTGSGQWAAFRRAPPAFSLSGWASSAQTSSSTADAYLVLPRKFGRDGAEGSLLDASHELNARLARAAV